MNIVFAGTPEFAVAPLRVLFDHGPQPCAVYTQPDRPAGRGRQLTPSPVKQLALEHGVPVYQPLNFKDAAAIEALRDLQPDLMIVVAYGLILPQAVLDIPRLGCVNIHASLLPRWRGAAPIQRAVLAGDAETGVTLMNIELKMDAGVMLRKAATPIQAGESAGELHDRLSVLGAELLRDVLPDLINGRLSGEVQDEAQVTYAEKLSKAEARIDWTQPAHTIERQVRAFNPWPVAETDYAGATLRIWRAEADAQSLNAEPGRVCVQNKQLWVATGAGRLRLLEVQLPGGKRLSAEAFLNSNDLDGIKLG